MKETLITFDKKTGNPSIEVNGVTGGACLEITKPLEEAMGMSDVERVEKDEMLLPQQTEEEVQTW